VNYGNIARRQGATQAHSDIAEFGVAFAQQVASRMRRDNNTPYADGYCDAVWVLS
jgi:hypothetical protein